MESYTIADIPQRGDVRPAPAPEVPRPLPAWTVRIPASLDISAIKPAHFKMLMVLERFCRAKSYTWANNPTIQGLYGGGLTQVKQVLGEMASEEFGYIYRLPVRAGVSGSRRAGIFLHKRLDPDLPVEDRPPPPEAVGVVAVGSGRAVADGQAPELAVVAGGIGVRVPA